MPFVIIERHLAVPACQSVGGPIFANDRMTRVTNIHSDLICSSSCYQTVISIRRSE